MAPLKSVMAFYAFILLLLLLLPLAAAQSIQPSNDTLLTQAADLSLSASSSTGMTAGTVSVYPLTTDAGQGQSATALSVTKIQGTLKITDGHTQGVSKDNIAYISCDPNDNSSNLSPTDVMKQVIASVTPPVQAILLYSLTSHCTITGDFGYKTILTVVKADDARMLKNIIDGSALTNLPSATITATAAASSTGIGGSSSSTTQTSAPTTAVAMSILYSITGIITLLFLIIIATGAVRAHRHPERYGPRGGFAGRPRQSRAKGLARAMLETLPIVKFGDPDPVKPGDQAVELEEGRTSPDVITPATQTGGSDAEPTSTKAATVPESGIGPDTNNGQRSHKENLNGVSELGCSICTEDFEKGEDVRVLPCNHKYHPACIDPWLLNVSGTCPLCRVDLRPVESRISQAETVPGEHGVLPPPLISDEGAEGAEGAERLSGTHARRGPVARRLDAALLRNAPAHVRLAALRALRDQEIEAASANPAPEVQREEQSRRARLTSRLRDVFRIRTRTVAEAGPVVMVATSSAPDAPVAVSPAPVLAATSPAAPAGAASANS